jgi:hypothetical protein
MFLFVTANNGSTFTPPGAIGSWKLINDGPGNVNSFLWAYYHDVQVGDGTSYVLTFSGGPGESNAFLCEVTGGAFGLQQATLFSGGGSAFPTTPAVIPYAPSSLAIGYSTEHNSFDSPLSYWTEIAFVDGGGATNQLSVQTGPTTSTNAVAFATTWGGTDTVAGLLVIPPSAASGSTTGVTSVSGITPIVVTGSSTAPIVGLNAPLGPSYGGTGLASPGPSLNILTSDGTKWNSSPNSGITVTGSPYIGISLPAATQYEVINEGIQSVTGPSFTASNTGIVFTGPNVLQTAPNTFYISVAGAASGGGGTYPPTAYDTNRMAIASLKYYWPLNDASGNFAALVGGSGANLTASGSWTYQVGLGFANGDVGARCDASTTYARTTGITFPTGAWTVECVQSALFTSSGTLVIGWTSLNSPTNTAGAALGSASSALQAYNGTGAAIPDIVTSSPLDSLTSYMTHLVYDGATFYFYINNILIGKTTEASSVNNLMVIGALAGSTGAPTAGTFSGALLAKLGVYNAALTDKQRASALNDMRHS